jgi:hypothetical protein
MFPFGPVVSEMKMLTYHQEDDGLPEYLQDLSEVLLFLLLPQEDFHNKSFRYILRVSTDIELILFLLFKLSFLNV